MPVVTPGPSSSTTSLNPAGDGLSPFQIESSVTCVTAYPAAVSALLTSPSVPPSAITSTLPIDCGPGRAGVAVAVASADGAATARVTGAAGSFGATWMFSVAGAADRSA